MNEELLRSLKGEWKCVYSNQDKWCTFEKISETHHIHLTRRCNGYEDGNSCPYKETPENLR